MADILYNDRLSSYLSQLTPFSERFGFYPVIKYGDGRRAIRCITKPINAKGLITVETVPDLADGGKSREIRLSPSTRILAWIPFKE